MGVLIPLSGYGQIDAAIEYTTRACTSPACGFDIRIDYGKICFSRPMAQSRK